MADKQDAISNIPTADSLPLRSNPSNPTTAHLPPTTSTGSSTREREAWMLDPGTIDPAIPSRSDARSGVRSDAPVSANPGGDISPPRRHGTKYQNGSAAGAGGVGGEDDFFSSFGTEHKRKDPSEAKPDPAKAQPSKNELNTQYKEGKTLDEYTTNDEKKKAQPGGPGYQWRMMKLKRMQEQAEEQ